MNSTSFTQTISNSLTAMRPSERKVAEYVLAHAEDVIQMRIVDLSAEAAVSEPTVVRFCRAVGSDGFQDFKLKLAQQLASSPTIGRVQVTDNDSVHAYSQKVFDTSIDVLIKTRDSVDKQQIAKAVSAISKAGRICLFGFGGSAPVAMDAQHRFFRLNMLSTAYNDPHLQMMASLSLNENDVVIALSQSGRTKVLMDSLREVKRRGAIIISIAPHNTPVLETADIQIAVDADETFDVYSPLCGRLAHLVIIDVIAAGAAQLLGDSSKLHINRLRQSLRAHRINYHDSSWPNK